MKIILFGKPASGKGTQAEEICNEFNLEHISTGDIFRHNIKDHTKLGKKVQDIMARGDLVSDDLVIEITRDYLKTKGDDLLFDGFPRTLKQAKAMQNFVQIDKVIDIEILDEIAIKRITARRVCKNGHTYSLLYHKPKKDGICDICGEKLFHRQDDSKKIAQNRLHEYKELTEPILEFLKDKVVIINGDQSIKNVTQDIRNELKKI